MLTLGGFFAYRVFRPDGELQALVPSVAPQHETPECSWGKNLGSRLPGEPKSYYGCLYFAPGGLSSVGRTLAGQAARQGLAVSCRVGRHMVAVAANRGDKTVFADVRESGFSVFRSHHLVDPSDTGADVIASSDVYIPPHVVFVDVSAHDGGSRAAVGARCTL